jgi:DNA-binding transcriptional ArsR family regulator
MASNEEQMVRTRDRKTRLEAVQGKIREVTRLTLVFSEQMALQLGVSTTDLECLNLVATSHDVTAGALATKTGLTTGAITGAIDRLERAGLVERRRDDADRRKVIVAEKSATWRSHPSSALMRRTVADVLARYDDGQLAFLERALGELCEAAKVVIASMRTEDKAEASISTPKGVPAPKRRQGRTGG